MSNLPTLSPQMLIQAYAQGVFPMATNRRGSIAWFSPDPRAVLPLDAFHVPRSLARRVRSGRFTVTHDRAFSEVMRYCAQPRPYAEQTWINDEIIEAYTQLHELGLAHSVEAWTQPSRDGAPPRLVGGLYGVAIGGAFFGESMFSRATDASKVCLVKLVEHLRERGYTLLDAQFHNPHLEQFGLVEVPRDDYLDELASAIALDVDWDD